MTSKQEPQQVICCTSPRSFCEDALTLLQLRTKRNEPKKPREVLNKDNNHQCPFRGQYIVIICRVQILPHRKLLKTKNRKIQKRRHALNTYMHTYIPVVQVARKRDQRRSNGVCTERLSLGDQSQAHLVQKHETKARCKLSGTGERCVWCRRCRLWSSLSWSCTPSWSVCAGTFYQAGKLEDTETEDPLILQKCRRWAEACSRTEGSCLEDRRSSVRRPWDPPGTRPSSLRILVTGRMSEAPRILVEPSWTISIASSS